jgi:hypothetical protein
MSKGPGSIEKRIVELFAATRDRPLSIADIADHASGWQGRRQAVSNGFRPHAPLIA